MDGCLVIINIPVGSYLSGCMDFEPYPQIYIKINGLLSLGTSSEPTVKILGQLSRSMTWGHYNASNSIQCYN